jgi:hypothetical protein
MSRLRLRFVGIAVLLVVAAAFFFWRDDAHVTWSSFPSPAEDPSLKKDAVEQQLPLKVSTAGTSPISKPTKTSELPTDLPALPKPETTRWQDSESPAATPSPSAPPKPCLNFMELQREKQKPWSTGWRRFAYNRPGPECRTFNLPAMEKLIEKMKGVIKDPDLFRLFENSYPNTLDTMIKWRGYANIGDPATGNETVTDEELTYVITGDVWNSFLPFHLLLSSTRKS